MKRIPPSPHTTGQSWLWVTRPEYYLDEQGQESESLGGDDDSGWWTCHKDTKKGDLAFLWRTSPKRDIGYLMRCLSDAFSLSDDPYAVKQRWSYGCQNHMIAKLATPVTLADIRAEPGLADWGALKAQFQGGVFKISPEQSQILMALVHRKNPPVTEAEVWRADDPELLRVSRESELEDTLSRELHRLRPLGYDLEIYRDPKSGRSGRQYVCAAIRGRMDLLCRDKKRGSLVVIELKNEEAGPKSFSQICGYVGWASAEIGRGQKVEGLVISRGADAKFRAAARLTPQIRQVDLREVGFE